MKISTLIIACLALFVSIINWLNIGKLFIINSELELIMITQFKIQALHIIDIEERIKKMDEKIQKSKFLVGE